MVNGEKQTLPSLLSLQVFLTSLEENGKRAPLPPQRAKNRQEKIVLNTLKCLNMRLLLSFSSKLSFSLLFL